VQLTILSNDGRLRFELLGSLRVLRGSHEIVLNQAQQRAVLAVLLTRVDRPVSRDELVRCLWSEPPPTAINMIQTYVSRLRRLLRSKPAGELPPAEDPLVSTHHGYRLAVPPDAVDLTRWKATVGRFRRHRAMGDLAAARDAGESALRAFSGEALVDVPGPWAAAERVYLEQERLEVLEQKLALDLELGRLDDLLVQATRLVADYPLRERLRELLMLALYGAGRRAEALAAFQDARRTIADELGISPGPRLTHLHRCILDGDESALPAVLSRPDPPVPGPGVGTDAPGDGPALPARLPAPADGFVGRVDEMRRLGSWLQAEDERPVVAVVGPPGAGKTALALAAATGAQARFPDGQHYLRLHNRRNRPRRPTRIIARILRDLGVEPERVPADLDGCSALYRSVLCSRRALIVLDDAASAEQVRPLLPGGSSCRVLVMSRSNLYDLTADTVALGALGSAPARDLLARHAGASRLAREPSATAELLRMCDGLPLAIRVAGARLAARPNRPVSWLVELMRDADNRLGELVVGGLSVVAALRSGYDRLARRDRDAAAAFRALGAIGPRQLDLTVAAEVLQVPQRTAEQRLETLVDAFLVTSPRPGHYRVPELFGLFARGVDSAWPTCGPPGG
jgi:DNA-binding SARP family transcriptional activator